MIVGTESRWRRHGVSNAVLRLGRDRVGLDRVTNRPFADVLPDGAILSELYQFRADGGLDVGDDESASPLFDVPGSRINVLSAASGRYLAFADDAGELDPSMLVVARL